MEENANLIRAHRLPLVALFAAGLLIFSFAQNASAATPEDFGLKEGDVISSHAFDGDPDVFIINQHGYKRLFLNPTIFRFYGHLGGFAKVKSVPPETRDAFVTSGLYRDCEVGSQNVYALEIKGEDSGTFHHLDVAGSMARAQDPNFFRKVFCINKRETNWYPKAAAYTSISQVPSYSAGIFAPSHFFLSGDFNVDGTVTIGELQKAINFSLGEAEPDFAEKILADANGDGSIDRSDISVITNNQLGDKPYSCAALPTITNGANYLAGDLNQDGKVTIGEVTKATSFIVDPSKQISERERFLADADGNGTITEDDVVFARNNLLEDKPLRCVKFQKRIPPRPPFIKVISPNGGEHWTIGSTQTIRWMGGGWNWRINILLLNAAKTRTVKEIALSTANDGFEEWTVPSDLGYSDEYIMRIACQGCSSRAKGWFDDSDKPFRITAAPAALPDLTLKNLKGTDFGISVDLCNDGNAALTSFPLKIAANGITHTFSFPNLNLDPGSCHTDAWAYSMWNMQEGQSYLVVAEADPENVIKEIHEGNNGASKKISRGSASYAPTLSIERLPSIAIYPLTHIELKAIYDSDGNGPASGRNVSSLSSLISSNHAVAAVGVGESFVNNPTFRVTSVGSGNAVIVVLYSGLAAQVHVAVDKRNISVTSIENGEPEKNAILNLVIEPDRIQVGETVTAKVFYDPDGASGENLPQDVSTSASWISANKQVASISVKNTADITGLAKGTSGIIVLYKGLGTYRNVFVAPSIIVLSPNGGETWKIGSTQTVRWGGGESTDAVSIYLYDWATKSATASYSPTAIIASFSKNDGIETWTIPDSISVGSYYIRVIVGNRLDDSDAAFSIVAAAQPPTHFFLSGDFNVDGEVTIDEVQKAANFALGKADPDFAEKILADTDGDGDIDVIDVNVITDNQLGDKPYSCAALPTITNGANYLAGDLNQDGKVTIGEVTKATSFIVDPSKQISERERFLADADGNGTITEDDVVFARNNLLEDKPLRCVQF